jgi:hypothetical protein
MKDEGDDFHLSKMVLRRSSPIDECNVLFTISSHDCRGLVNIVIDNRQLQTISKTITAKKISKLL